MKAIIKTGASQQLVAEGDIVASDLIQDTTGKVEFKPLLVIADDKVHVGRPEVTGATVTAEVVDAIIRDPKVTAIRFKPKKRVHKLRGHRQKRTTLRITSINT